MDKQHVKALKAKYRKRMFILSAGFFGVFMSFNVAQSMATSVIGSLGNVCLATLYSTFCLACVTAPRAVNYLGPKNSMMLGAVPYIAMILSMVRPGWVLSITCNFLVGLGAPLLWTGQGVYLAQCAAECSKATGEPMDKVTNDFNSYFFSYFQLNGTVGLLLASVVLSSFSSNGNIIHILFIGLGGVAAAGAFIFTFLPAADSTPAGSSYGAPEDRIVNDFAGDQSPTEVPNVSLWQTLMLLGDTRMLLLVPVIFYNGLSLGYFFGDFTANIVTPGLGSAHTGLVVAAFFAVNSVVTRVWGSVASTSFGRKGLVWLATFFHMAFFGFIYFWHNPQNYLETSVNNETTETKLHTPLLDNWLWIMGCAAVFALGDAVWESQVPAILQTFYEAEDVQAAMANLKMWQSLGFALQFAMKFVIGDFGTRTLICGGAQVLAFYALAYLDVAVSPLDGKKSSKTKRQYSNLPNEDHGALYD